MGCDIHMVLEQRHNNRWVGIRDYDGLYTTAMRISPKNYGDNAPEIDNYMGWVVRNRNYELFSKLASVRGHGPPPRGLPKDISDLARIHTDDWGGDGHSHSWGLLSEIGGLFVAHYTPQKALTEDRYKAVLELFGVPFMSPDNLDQLRLVYWFDN